MNLVDIARALGNISPYAALVVLGIYFINRYFETQVKRQNGAATYLPGSLGSLQPQVIEQIIEDALCKEREAAWNALAMRRNEEIHKVSADLLRQYFGSESLYLQNQRTIVSLLEQAIKEIQKLRFSGRVRGKADDSP